MIKTYPDQRAAEQDLYEHGFRQAGFGAWFKPGYIAAVHPIPGTASVRVAIREHRPT